MEPLALIPNSAVSKRSSELPLSLTTANALFPGEFYVHQLKIS